MDWTSDPTKWIAILLVAFNMGVIYAGFKIMKKMVEEHQQLLGNGKFVRVDICELQHKDLRKQISGMAKRLDWLTNHFYRHVLQNKGTPPPGHEQGEK